MKGRRNAQAWMYLPDDDQQLTIIGQLAKTTAICVSKNRALIDFWGHGSALPDGPLVVYLRDNLKEVDDIGGYELWTRPA
ncbi:MAG TPA: hypothetical protein VGS16_07575 [Candidatus Dormibacteraeota bacterium]|nr:hypothetical protein [Candidatus Dormibacteraeota bacterium]